jgi:hypothetical protein
MYKIVLDSLLIAAGLAVSLAPSVAHADDPPFTIGSRPAWILLGGVTTGGTVALADRGRSSAASCRWRACARRASSACTRMARTGSWSLEQPARFHGTSSKSAELTG